MAPTEDSKPAAEEKNEKGEVGEKGEKGEKGADAPEDPPIVKELKEIDDKYLALEKEYEKEVNELMKKYTEKQKPFLEERKKILTTVEGEAPATGTPALDGFWLTAMEHHPAFEEVIQEWDHAVLKFLVDIEKSNLDESDNAKGFKLVFHFAENPYFTNTTLWKEYHTEESNPYSGDLDTKKIVASEIDWKAGKNVTVEKVAKKVKGGGAKKSKQKKEKEQARPSFFRDFLRSLHPGMKLTEDMLDQARQICDDEEEDEEEEDGEEIVEMLMENDYEVGCALRDNIVPFAVRWYTGEAAPDDDDSEDEEEEDEEEEEEDDSEDEPVPRKGKGKGRGAAAKKKTSPKTSPEAKPAGDPKEECKQQ